MPGDACKKFGPQPPDVERGKPALRPRDPDVTGGFYQPVRAKLEASDDEYVAFALERIRCRLANAPADVTAMFNMLSKANTNPITLSSGRPSIPTGRPSCCSRRVAGAPAFAHDGRRGCGVRARGRVDGDDARAVPRVEHPHADAGHAPRVAQRVVVRDGRRVPNDSTGRGERETTPTRPSTTSRAMSSTAAMRLALHRAAADRPREDIGNADPRALLVAVAGRRPSSTSACRRCG